MFQIAHRRRFGRAAPFVPKLVKIVRRTALAGNRGRDEEVEIAHSQDLMVAICSGERHEVLSLAQLANAH